MSSTSRTTSSTTAGSTRVGSASAAQAAERFSASGCASYTLSWNHAASSTGIRSNAAPRRGRARGSARAPRRGAGRRGSRGRDGRTTPRAARRARGRRAAASRAAGPRGHSRPCRPRGATVAPQRERVTRNGEPHAREHRAHPRGRATLRPTRRRRARPTRSSPCTPRTRPSRTRSAPRCAGARRPIRAFYATLEGLEQETQLLATRIAGGQAAFLFEIVTKADDKSYTLAPIDVMTFDDDGLITTHARLLGRRRHGHRLSV